MSIFKGYLYKYKKIILFIVFIVICFFLMFFSSKSAVVTFKRIGLSFLHPFEFVITNTGNFFKNTFNSISELQKSRKEIKSLQNELNQYKKILIDFNELNTEILNLKQLLELKEDIIYETEACEIIGRDPKKMFNMLIINKGFKDGIKENQPVISYASGRKTLIGKVIETTPFSSKIITLHNSNFSIGAIISDRTHTIIQGSNKKPGIVKLLYLPRNYKLKNSKEDLIYTSGDSLIYPSGLIIGKMVKIYPSKRYENYNEADVQIAVDLSKVEYVLVLKVDYNKEDFKHYRGFLDD